MKYIAHTKETVPVLREKAPDKPKSYTGHHDNEYAIREYINKLKEHDKYISSLRSIQIHPDHIHSFVDGKEYNESEFEVIQDCKGVMCFIGNCDACRFAILNLHT